MSDEAAPTKAADTAVGFIDQLSPEAQTYVQLTVIVVCIVMLLGGLLVFYLRSAGSPWKSDYVQVLGTIFFFPTLIILAVYLNLSRDAVVGILGAFLGSIFTRNIPPSSPPPGEGLSPGPAPASDTAPAPTPGPEPAKSAFSDEIKN
jgi:hypothetical protein